MDLPAAATSCSLKSVFDTIERHFRCLEALQQNTEQPVFVSMLTSKLPSVVLHQMELKRTDSHGLPHHCELVSSASFRRQRQRSATRPHREVHLHKPHPFLQVAALKLASHCYLPRASQRKHPLARRRHAYFAKDSIGCWTAPDSLLPPHGRPPSMVGVIHACRPHTTHINAGGDVCVGTAAANTTIQYYVRSNTRSQ